MIRGRVYTLHLWPPLAHARHYTGFVPREQRLPERLADHALGRGARLTQVQVERGGSWVLAQVEPGNQATERRLKQHGAPRRCEVCKAMESYRAGQISRDQALERAGWGRASEHERGLLLDMLTASSAAAGPAAAPARPGRAARQQGDLPQSVARTAQAGFPVENPLTSSRRAASGPTRRRRAASTAAAAKAPREGRR